MTDLKSNLHNLLLPPQVLPELYLMPLDQVSTFIGLGVRVETKEE
ncbi:MAG TPA: hypothetical protein VFG10_07795 [Saprospiraceae bacterium]|nr:hypothetical protein [Saprospiraceae bacterium]